MEDWSGGLREGQGRRRLQNPSCSGGWRHARMAVPRGMPGGLSDVAFGVVAPWWKCLAVAFAILAVIVGRWVRWLW